MKIAYITSGIAPYVLGGLQAVSRRHIDILAKAGHEVVAIHTLRDRTATYDNALPAKVYTVDWPRSTGVLNNIPGHYVRELISFSEKVEVILENERPDIVYADAPLLNKSLTDNQLMRTPFIFHPHGLEMFQNKGSFLEDLRSWPMRGITRSHCAGATNVISQGGHLDRILMGTLGVPTDKVRHLPNCVDTTKEPRTRSDRIKNKFLFIGRREPRKGLQLLLTAMGRVEKAELDVVGIDGAPASRLSGRSHFHGVVKDRKLINTFYDNTDWLALPSWAEGMPTVLLEAMSRGVPVVATDVGAVPELVIDGQTGWLAKPGDVSSLTVALNKAISATPDEYQAMSARCVAKIKNGFLSDKVGKQLLTLFNEALELNSSRREAR